MASERLPAGSKAELSRLLPAHPVGNENPGARVGYNTGNLEHVDGKRLVYHAFPAHLQYLFGGRIPAGESSSCLLPEISVRAGRGDDERSAFLQHEPRHADRLRGLPEIDVPGVCVDDDYIGFFRIVTPYTASAIFAPLR